MNHCSKYVAALALAAMAAGAHADLNTTVYQGYGFDLDGNISFDGLNEVGSFVDGNVDHWDGSLTYSWNPLGQVDNYSVRWTGFLVVPTAGFYEFRTVADDGVQVFIGNDRIIHQPSQSWYGEAFGLAVLEAGAVAIDVRYYEAAVYDGIVLQWKNDAGAWETIPTSAFVTAAVPEPATALLAIGGLGLLWGRSRRQRG